MCHLYILIPAFLIYRQVPGIPGMPFAEGAMHQEVQYINPMSYDISESGRTCFDEWAFKFV